MTFRLILLYAGALAIGAFALQWLEYQYLTRVFASEIYLLLIAALFTALGAWAALKLARPKAAVAFTRNDAAIKSLGLSAREFEVLELLADGQSNKEIARSLDVSPNTVKTHLANLYGKLEASSRLQAVTKARDLGLIP